MAGSWVGGVGAFRTTSGSLTLTLPAFGVGDLAVLVIGNDAGTDPNYVTPSGWTFRGKTAATNMYSYIYSRVLQTGDVSVSFTLAAGGNAAIGIWRGVTWGSLGTFGVRSGTVTTVTAPDHATATGMRAHIFSDRSIAAAAGEADTLPTALTYGTARNFYPGDTTLNAAVGVSAVYFADSASGSGANTATLKDSSTNAWGVQVDLVALPKAATLTDTFDTYDAGKWPDLYGTVALEGGRVAVTEGVGQYAGFATAVGAYDLTNSSVFVKATRPTVEKASTETTLTIYGPTTANGLWFVLYYDAGQPNKQQCVMRQRIAGVDDNAWMPYDPATMAYIRIRHAAGTVYWDTSPDGATWTNRRTLVSAINVNAVRIELSIGQWQVEANQSKGYFDNVNVGGGRPKANLAGNWVLKPAKLFLGNTLATPGLTAFGIGGPSVKTVSVTIPAGVTVGSQLMLVISGTTGSVENWNTAVLSGAGGSGWTSVPPVAGTSGIHLFLWRKVATAGDRGAVVTFTAGAAATANGMIAGIFEVKDGLFHSAVGVYNVGAAYGGAAGGTDVPIGRQIVASVGVRGTTDVGTTYTAPSGWTVVGSQNTNAWASAKQYLMFAVRDAGVSGTVPAITASPGFDDDSGATFNRLSWSMFTGAWVEKPMKRYVGGQWRSLGDSPPAFSPASLTGLVGWWDASTLGLADGQMLTDWPDLSGAGTSHDPVLRCRQGPDVQGQ